MIKKSLKLVITFPTTTAAMAMEKACKELGASGRLIPVPPSIDAGCGLAWCAEPACEYRLCAIMQQQGIDYQGLYQRMV